MTIDATGPAGQVTPQERAALLVEALPYIQRFRGRVVVVKYGGNAMVDPSLATTFAEDIVLMHSVGIRPVVVHGGGPQISDLMSRLGKVPEFRDGLHVTDAETVDIARMVLVGKVNRDIVGAINRHGPLAVGVSGEDAHLIRAEARHPDLGFVGDVDSVNPVILERLLAEDVIPVVSTIGADASGQAYNINADAVAGALGVALGAEKVIYLTDVAGLLAEVADPTSVISHIDADALGALVADGTLTGGMIPKIDACLHAVRGGVGSAHLLDGRLPHVLLLELFSDHGVGTMITSGGRTVTDHATAMGAPPLERCPLMPTYGAPMLQLVRGEGTRVWDRDGTEYLDLLAGLAVTSLGHSHPAVADALAAQARTLLHVSNLFGTEPGWQVARTLDRLLGVGQPGWPDPAEATRGQVFFTNSGAEANECALKLARRFGGRGRHVVVSAFGSFHGRTLATLHATGQPAKHEAFQPLPEGFRHVAWHDLDALEAALDPTVAAVLLEAVQGEGGVNPATAEYFQGVRRLCDERGILFIVDEVQTGLGRCGAWFAHQRLGVVPDVVTMAKALGNGVPIGACWATAEVAAAFEPGDHATTFGGQPLATAAARAVLEVMEAEDVPARAERAGARLKAGALALDGVADVRGLGLLLAIELYGHDAPAVATRLLEAGAIVNAVTPTALRVAPSLLISDDDLDQAVALLAEALR